MIKLIFVDDKYQTEIDAWRNDIIRISPFFEKLLSWNKDQECIKIKVDDAYMTREIVQTNLPNFSAYIQYLMKCRQQNYLGIPFKLKSIMHIQIFHLMNLIC